MLTNILILFLTLFSVNGSVKIDDAQNLVKDLITLGPFIAGIAAVIGVIISIISIFHFGTKKQKMESLIEFFKILNDETHREARKEVYSAFLKYEKGRKDAFNDSLIQNAIAMVRADMDQIGTLYHHNLIPRKVFLEAYWNTVLLCWKALQDNIEEERIKRGYPTYMKYFQELKNECKKHWEKHHPEIIEIKHYEIRT